MLSMVDRPSSNNGDTSGSFLNQAASSKFASSIFKGNRFGKMKSITAT
jgi:hypothetical protein